MGSVFKRFWFRAVMLCVLVTLLFISAALADNVIILTVSDDHLASCTDENGHTLREAIEIYVRALELKGDTVQVFGSRRTSRDPAVVYSAETGTFDWTAGDESKNDAYYFRTLEQLGKTDFAFDRVVVVTGQLRNSQSRNSGKTTYPSSPDVPVMVYGAVPLSGSKTQAEAYQDASGIKFTSAGETGPDGFVRYGNTIVKEAETFDARQTLSDLMMGTFSGRIDQSGGVVTIPEAISSKSILCITGSDLSAAKLVLNGEAVYRITSDPAESSSEVWYGPSFSFGSGQLTLIEIPDGIRGNLKISDAADAELSIFYVEADDYAQKLQNASVCPAGLEYTPDGSVLLTLSDERAVQELKLIYPELSFQAQVTLLESTKTITLYSEDGKQIKWIPNPDENAELSLTLCATKDGTNLLPVQRLRYYPLSSALDALKPFISIKPSDQPVKRQEITVELTLVSAEGGQAQARRVSDWLFGAAAAVTDQAGTVVGSMTYNTGSGSFVSAPIEMPAHEGTYHWQIAVSSGPKYAIAWEKTFQTKDVVITNQSPTAEAGILPSDISISALPGENAEYAIPAGLFRDPDGDPLTVAYTVQYAGKDVREGSAAGKDGYSPEIPLSDLNQFGDWKITLTAEDNDKAVSQPVTVSLHIMDSNNAPTVDAGVREKIPEEVSLTVQPDEAASYTIPAGLFTDPDKDSLTVTCIAYYNQAQEKKEEIKSETGVSPEITISDLNKFGDWRITLTAQDKYGVPGGEVAFNIHVTDGNTAPHANPGKLPEADGTIPLLRLSDYQVILAKGLYTDNEQDNLTVWVSVTDPQDNTETVSYKGKEGSSGEWKYSLPEFGTWKFEIHAVDEHQAESEPYLFQVTLTDALKELPGMLKANPDNPEKGDSVRFELSIEWPDEYRDLKIREWLEECTVSLVDNFGAGYPMTLAENTLVFTAENVVMPTEETDLTFSASVVYDDTERPRTFDSFNTVDISIKNSAPVIIGTAAADETRFIFNLSDYQLHIPSNLFRDEENDPYTVQIDLEDGKGNVSQAATIQNGEEYDLKLPDFGSWTVRLTATDVEESASDPFTYAKVTIHDLKKIVIIAGAALLLIIAVLVTILRIRYKRNLPRFKEGDCIVFINGKGEVSPRIRMPKDDTRSFPLSGFAVSISVLLSNEQWSSLKEWMICPSKGDKPEFRKAGAKGEKGETEIELGEGLKAVVNPK